jgi:hypothetical protein
MVTWKGCRIAESGSTSSYCIGICLEELKKAAISIIQASWSIGPDSNREPPKCKSEALPLEKTYLITNVSTSTLCPGSEEWVTKKISNIKQKHGSYLATESLQK